MPERHKKDKADRRDFLKMASLGTIAAGTAVLSSSDKLQAAVPDTDENKTGYQETEHVKAFYKSARF
jgi:hypothetical protein